MRGLAVLAFAASLGLTKGAAAQFTELQASYDFLVRERTAGGVLLDFSLGQARAQYQLPASYLDTHAYWGAYVCESSKAKCAVHDTYNSVTYELVPAAGPAGKLQVERVNAHNGANIYDAATWQIAVVLGAVKGRLRQSSPTSAYALASGLTEVLHQSARRDDANVAPGTKRAVTVGTSFVYNGAAISDDARAYAFRTLAPEWIARDPLMDSPHASWITAGNLPLTNPAYEAGRITWSDWKPITGENAWAFLIGPLHAAYLHHVVERKEAFIPFKDLSIQNALGVLPTFAAMQSAIGAIYYAPAGTIGNEGDGAVNPYQVSVENNFSVYAGLGLLRETLRASLKDQAADRARIEQALILIDTMIHGGEIGPGRKTKGLLSFFKDAAWREGGFVQGGLANDPRQRNDWMPTTSPKAVDVDTWGIAALGTKRIDAWFGDGAAFATWQRLKRWGGYGVGSTLGGVGYSDQDGNGVGENGAYRQGVLSAEWTAGAVNAVRNMIVHYAGNQKYLASLKADEAAMMAGLQDLRIDRYTSAAIPGKPDRYAKLVSVPTKPYLYASRRYHIPFGWYANPLPSTASTAWVIMLAYGYDPFGFGGAPN